LPPIGRGWLTLWPRLESSEPCRPPEWPEEGELLIDWVKRYGRVRLGVMSPVVEAVRSALMGEPGTSALSIVKAHKFMSWSKAYRYRVIEYFLEEDAEGLAEFLNNLADEYDAEAEAGIEHLVGRAVIGGVAHLTFDPMNREESPYLSDAAARVMEEFGARAVVMTAAAGIEAVFSGAYPVREGEEIVEYLRNEFGGELGFWRGFPSVLYPEGVRVTDIIQAITRL